MKWLLSVDLKQRAAVQRYCAWVRQLDIEPVVASFWHYPKKCETMNALLLCGGGDVHPIFYGERLLSEAENVVARRDRFELDLVAEFLRMRKAVFGICRGIQVINVALRGGLIQDVERWLREARGAVEQHRRIGDRDSEHPIIWDPSCALAQALNGVSEVNSAHHQAVHPERLGNNVRVAAWSPGGIIEAITVEGAPSPVVGVQWHPERLPPNHSASANLLRYFQQLAACSRR